MSTENRTELVLKKQELEERLDKIQKDLSTKLSADFEEQAVELENRDVLIEIARVTEEEIVAINLKINGTKQ